MPVFMYRDEYSDGAEEVVVLNPTDEGFEHPNAEVIWCPVTKTIIDVKMLSDAL